MVFRSSRCTTLTICVDAVYLCDLLLECTYAREVSGPRRQSSSLADSKAQADKPASFSDRVKSKVTQADFLQFPYFRTADIWDPRRPCFWVDCLCIIPYYLVLLAYEVDAKHISSAIFLISRLPQLHRIRILKVRARAEWAPQRPLQQFSLFSPRTSARPPPP
jgi:hypothetical protein